MYSVADGWTLPPKMSKKVAYALWPLCHSFLSIPGCWHLRPVKMSMIFEKYNVPPQAWGRWNCRTGQCPPLPPCHSVRKCQVLWCPPLPLRPALSSPAMSRLSPTLPLPDFPLSCLLTKFFSRTMVSSACTRSSHSQLHDLRLPFTHIGNSSVDPLVSKRTPRL